MVSTQNGATMSVEDGPGRFKSPESRPGLMKFMDIVNTITQILTGAVVFAAFLSAIVFQGVGVAVHIYLCTIGYVILMTQAILGLSPHTGWARSFSHRHRRLLHWVMQVMGSALAVIGSCIIMVQKSRNFTSAHGILGILAMIFSILSMLGGLAHLLLNAPRLIKAIHCISGVITITIAYLALVFAFEFMFQGGMAIMAIIFTVVALIGILVTTVVNTFSRW